MCSHQNPPSHVSPRFVPVTFGHHPIYGMPLFFYRWLELKFTQTQGQAIGISSNITSHHIILYCKNISLSSWFVYCISKSANQHTSSSVGCSSNHASCWCVPIGCKIMLFQYITVLLHYYYTDGYIGGKDSDAWWRFITWIIANLVRYNQFVKINLSALPQSCRYWIFAILKECDKRYTTIPLRNIISDLHDFSLPQKSVHGSID